MALVWVRGGNWQKEEGVAVLEGLTERRQAVEARKFRYVHPGPGLTDTQQTRHRRAAHRRLKRSHAGARSRPADWRRVWGKPLSLQRYEIDGRTARAALGSAQEYWEFVRDIPVAEVIADAQAVTVAEDLLLQFLRKFGPLTYSFAIVESGIGEPDEVDLFGMDADLQSLGKAWEFVNRATVLSKAEQRKLLEMADLVALGEAKTSPRRSRDGKVNLRAEPDSLRAELWFQLFRRLESTPICRFCGAPIDQPRRDPTRGRPFRYCDKHRDSKFRKAVMRRSPAVVLRSLSELEPPPRRKAIMGFPSAF